MTETQEILILKDTVCGCKPVFEGEIVEAGKADAMLLKRLKKACDAPTEEKAEEEADEDQNKPSPKPKETAKSKDTGGAGSAGTTGADDTPSKPPAETGGDGNQPVS